MSPLRQFLYFDVGKKRVSRKAAKAQRKRDELRESKLCVSAPLREVLLGPARGDLQAGRETFPASAPRTFHRRKQEWTGFPLTFPSRSSCASVQIPMLFFEQKHAKGAKDFQSISSASFLVQRLLSLLRIPARHRGRFQRFCRSPATCGDSRQQKPNKPVEATARSPIVGSESHAPPHHL